MSRFTMLVNGKEKAGEVVEKNQARQIYNSIVHRSQDPGLLEYLGGEIFRANIFPIVARGSQTITLRFEQILSAQDPLVNYTYPVRASTTRGSWAAIRCAPFATAARRDSIARRAHSASRSAAS